MRINQFIAQATGLSRRAADSAIIEGRVKVGGHIAKLGIIVRPSDEVTLDDNTLAFASEDITIMLHKPVGYVVSRDPQGAKSIYELLPAQYTSLKPVGRLDKDSSGLLLLSTNGKLIYELTHPKFTKEKHYEISLNKELAAPDMDHIESGVQLDDGVSKLQLRGRDRTWHITMHEGRNRQIRRTFAELGYGVVRLHRTGIGEFTLDGLESGHWKVLKL